MQQDFIKLEKTLRVLSKIKSNLLDNNYSAKVREDLFCVDFESLVPGLSELRSEGEQFDDVISCIITTGYSMVDIDFYSYQKEFIKFVDLLNDLVRQNRGINT